MVQKVVKGAMSFEEGIQNLINSSNEDYRHAMTSESMIKEFESGWKVEYKKKYIKVIQRHSVFCFIAMDDFEKGNKAFKKGDILKAQDWSTPALNAPRGNVLEGNYNINWTGPLYLI